MDCIIHWWYIYSGVQDDKFALLYELNKKLKILVKTSVGKTDREVVEEIVAQGGIFGGLKCSNLIDSIGKKFISLQKLCQCAAPFICW